MGRAGVESRTFVGNVDLGSFKRLEWSFVSLANPQFITVYVTGLGRKWYFCGVSMCGSSASNVFLPSTTVYVLW